MLYNGNLPIWVTYSDGSRFNFAITRMFLTFEQSSLGSWDNHFLNVISVWWKNVLSTYFLTFTIKEPRKKTPPKLSCFLFSIPIIFKTIVLFHYWITLIYHQSSKALVACKLYIHENTPLSMGFEEELSGYYGRISEAEGSPSRRSLVQMAEFALTRHFNGKLGFTVFGQKGHLSF